MADDSLTVEQLKEQIIDDHYDGDCTKAQLIEHLDTLIAAVRADASNTASNLRVPAPVETAADTQWDEKAKWFRAGRQSAFDGLVAHFNECIPGRYVDPREDDRVTEEDHPNE